jgi:hypothetical protein
LTVIKLLIRRWQGNPCGDVQVQARKVMYKATVDSESLFTNGVPIITYLMKLEKGNAAMHVSIVDISKFA